MWGRKHHRHAIGQRGPLAAVLCLLGLCLLAQQPKQNTQTVRSRVFLLHADVLKKDRDGFNPDAQILVGNVKFRHDSIYMYCDSACFYEKENLIEAFDNVQMEQGDTLFLYGDYLRYNGDTQMAEVRYNVRMENRTTSLYTDSLNYDRVFNLGYFFDGGTLIDEENTLTSEWGEYSPATKTAVFNYNVKLVNPKFTLTSDTLRYNTSTKLASIVGPSNIDNGKNHIYSDMGFYNTANGQAQLLNRSTWTNGQRTMTGDSLFYDRTLAYGEAFRNVVYTDKENKNMLTGNYCYYNDSTKYAFATDNAMVVDFSQGDSLFLHGDTLMMHTFNHDTDSMYREMRAYYHTRAYRADLQAVCDSLVFSTKDSCITLYHDPIIWNTNKQILGDEIHIHLNDSTIDWFHVNEHALSIEQVDSANYNQIRGKEIKAYFVKGELDKVDVNGSVRMIYFPMEKDSTILLMNVSETSNLTMFVENRKMKRMVMSPKTEGTMYPMIDLPKKESRLDDFVWFDDIRPTSKADIFQWRAKGADQQLRKSSRGPVQLPNQELFNQLKNNK